MRQQALPRPTNVRRRAGGIRDLALRKVWLPRSAYAALPYLYIFMGIYAMTSALFLSHWSWIVPYLVLIGIGCVHAGAYVLSLRYRHRQDDSGKPANLRE